MEACLDEDTGLAVGHFAAPDTTDQDIGEQVNGVHMQTLADSHMHDKESDEGGRMVAGQNKTSGQMRALTMETGAQEQSAKADQSKNEKSCNTHSTSETNKEPVSESLEGYDVPDGLRSEELLSSVSEAPPEPTSVPIQPDPKKKQKLFKRSKKKSHEGNQPSNLTKDLLNVSLLARLSRKSLFTLFLLHFTVYFLCVTFVF